MKCRHCDADITLAFADLGSAPPSNAYLAEQALLAPEIYYPLRVRVCHVCWLVQTEDHAGREQLFADDYAYFSSFSTTWLNHAASYAAAMADRFSLAAQHRVVEVAANDGYLLQYVQAAGIPCYGIEPTASTAAAARAKGIEIVEAFFGADLARKLADAGKQADLMAANNVLAHVPGINDFVAGFSILLKPSGVATFEFPHLLNLVEQNQFDTLYHEHYSYLSLLAVERIFMANGLRVFDVEELPTHGGSLRVFASRRDAPARPESAPLEALRRREADAGMDEPGFYQGFQAGADKVKNETLAFLLDVWRERKKIAAYGAAAKGNTLLNYAGVRHDLLAFAVDRNPAKQGKFMPGSHIAIVDESQLRLEKPDYVLILPWNLKDEVMAQLAYVREWGGRFVTAVPSLRIW